MGMNCAELRSPRCFNLEPARARHPELGQLCLALKNLGKKLQFNLAWMLLELGEYERMCTDSCLPYLINYI